MIISRIGKSQILHIGGRYRYLIGTGTLLPFNPSFLSLHLSFPLTSPPIPSCPCSSPPLSSIPILFLFPLLLFPCYPFSFPPISHIYPLFPIPSLSRPLASHCCPSSLSLSSSLASVSLLSLPFCVPSRTLSFYNLSINPQFVDAIDY